MSIHFTVWETEAPPAFPNARKEAVKASHALWSLLTTNLETFLSSMRAEAISCKQFDVLPATFSGPASTPAARVWSYWSWSSATLGLWKHKHLRTGTGWCSLGARTGGGDWSVWDEQRESRRAGNIPSLIPSLASASLLHPTPEFILPRTT